MSTAGVTSLRVCGHADVDLDALLADDRLAAVLAAPVIPSTEPHDLQLWLLRTYRRVAGPAATRGGACALIRAHPLTRVTPSTCKVVKVAWRRTEDEVPLTDTGNAHRLAVLAGTDIAHDPAVGWRFWTGSSWLTDPDGVVVQRFAKRVADQLATEAAALRDRARAVQDSDDEATEQQAEQFTERAARIAGWANKSQSATAIAAMVKLVRDEPGVLTRAEQWDADPRLLACPGVTIELRDDGHRIRPPRRGDRLTRVTRGRPGTGATAPVWEAFLRRALPDPDVRRYFQRLAGYSLLGANPERLLVILIGITSSGKSTASEVIAYVLGDHGGAFDLSLFRGRAEEGPRPDLLAALGRRIITTSEASDRWRLHADAIKRLTGGDTMRARTLHSRTYVEQRPAFTPWIATNAAPSIDGADQALWRRLVVVPFTVGIDPDEQDTGLGERIRTAEADGVLDWLLAGWADYCQQGLGDVPPACAEAAMQIRSDLSYVDHWLAEATEQGAEHTEALDELWRAWRTWCVDSGVPEADRGSRIALGRWLTDRGYGSR
ncbi:MAG: phage/plasmid primase, P4 family, partial [Actinomycetota bacterium]|nr:phage/plasmid primase, P4 family [Actinomycetota bacterium]